jgi:PASTA domain
MAGRFSWYDILGVLPGASDDEVRHAFAVKADVLRFELISGAPTRVLSATGRARRAIEAARHILTDPERRRRYDEEIGLRPAGGGLTRPAFVPSELGPDPGATVRGGDSVTLTDVAGVLADWLAPHPAPPRRVTVPDVRGLFVGPCRRLITGLGLRIEVVALTEDPMPVEGLVVDQSPAPRATARRSSTVTVQVWHPRQRPAWSRPTAFR